MNTETGHVRLSVRVGLDTRLLGDDIGIPSLISSPNDSMRPLGLGSGKFDSGPARVDSISKLDRLRAIMSCLKGEELPLPLEGYEGGGMLMASRSLGESGGELRMPDGKGRGPRKRVFSRL